VRLHSYVVARDYGFAPNPFFGICTLATCKPRIRSVAQVGDWVVGTGSKMRRREKHLVYVMRITGAMTFDAYWNDPRFQAKKPNLRGSKKQAFGDNIYSRDSKAKRWCQADSHHSLTDGTPNPLDVRADTSLLSIT
jgi:Nucleotide modification associated domain 2